MPLEQFGVVYLEPEDLLGTHAAAVSCTIEDARRRIFRPEALESACDRPRHWAVYMFADFPLQAVGLAAGITQGHPFIDGNKRTAVLALEQFLLYNGLQLAASDDQLFEWILALTNGLDPGELAEQLRPFVVPAIPL